MNPTNTTMQTQRSPTRPAGRSPGSVLGDALALAAIHAVLFAAMVL